MIEWALVGLIVTGSVAGDILQSIEMKRHGEVRDFRPGMLGRTAAHLAKRGYLMLAVACMAVSFFAFMKLLSVADLSFAVPATAGSFVLETILARVLLKEAVDFRRWTGALLIAFGVALLAVK